jgi:hypothetical protein
VTDTKLLFLDLDGVLNGHEKHPDSHYCGMRPDLVQRLNRVLYAVPDAKIVISSAWRYMILEGAMTLKGFQYLISIHGVAAWDRLHGHTAADVPPDEQPSHGDVETWAANGLRWRNEQIAAYVAEHKPTRWAVVDDLPLSVPNFVQTDGTIGLTDADADRLIAILSDGATN